MSQEDTLLSSACDLLTHDWVKSFLFPADRTAFVRQLQAALSQQSAITARVRFGTYAPGPCATPALSRDLSLLCVPSFSTGGITVGFEITSCLRDTSPRAQGLPRYIARFARDDDEGVMLIVAEHARAAFTEVTCCALLSPGCRSHVFALMRARDLRAAIMPLGAGPAWRARYAHALKRAVAFAYSSIDLRDCPACGSRRAPGQAAARGTALCACRVAVKRKVHPLDHDTERDNMSTYTGSFVGLAWVRDVRRGVDRRQTLMSEMFAEFTHNRDIRRNLSAWAMTHAFRSEKMRLTNYEMPAVEECSTEESACESATREKKERAESGHVGAGSKVGQGDSITSSISNVELPPSIPEFGSPCTPTQDRKHGVEAVPCDTRPCHTLPPSLPATSRTQAHAERQSRRPQAEHGPGGVSVPGQVLVNVPTGTLLLPLSVPMHHPAQQALQPVPFRVQGLLSMATLPTATLTAPRNARLDAPMSKDEIRRARNRASAQRSNEKKKREVAKLKDDLDEFVRRKEVLIERESKLRDENRMLREMLGGIAQAVK